MAFTAGEVTNIANAALDFYFNKGDTFKQSIQAKPMVAVMEDGAKDFPGGKGDISLGVKGIYGAGGTNDALKGYTHDDAVGFYTPANIQRAHYPWREHHIGLTMTHTELKIDGISVVDTNGEDTRNHSRREMTVLVGLLDDKLEDLGEQYARSLNKLLWGEGTTDAKALAGIRSMIVNNPTTGTVGGIDRSVAGNSWWRNRFSLGIVSSPANGGVLWQLMQAENRQLRRYGGRPNKALCGQDFLAALEVEARANGYYTESGFTKGVDGAIGSVTLGNLVFEYDPTLDDLTLNKYCYIWDTRHIFLMKMENEWRKSHTPARPADKFVLYKSITSTGQLVARQLNSAGVYSIA